MKTLKKALIGVGSAAFAFFAVTFTIYFFNLDSKGLTLLEPLLLKHYEKIDKDPKVKTKKNL